MELRAGRCWKHSLDPDFPESDVCCALSCCVVLCHAVLQHDARAHVALGLAFMSTKDYCFAKRSFRAALAIDPDFPGGKKHHTLRALGREGSEHATTASRPLLRGWCALDATPPKTAPHKHGRPPPGPRP